MNFYSDFNIMDIVRLETPFTILAPTTPSGGGGIGRPNDSPGAAIGRGDDSPGAAIGRGNDSQGTAIGRVN